jgi:hypothetical protein
VPRSGSSVLSVNMNRFLNVWVADVILADVAEIMEDERLWNLESSMWFPLCGGNGAGVRRIARKKRFIANDMATMCSRRRNAHECRMFRRSRKTHPQFQRTQTKLQLPGRSAHSTNIFHSVLSQSPMRLGTTMGPSAIHRELAVTPQRRYSRCRSTL